MTSEPTWWYSDPAGLMPILLEPFARVYGHVAEYRFRSAAPYRSSLPVICVGNFTAGGTGKTPFVQMLVDVLTARGANPAIVTRGYGGTVRGPHWVNSSSDTAVSVGDEPLLLAESAPVMVARDRAAGARAIEADARAFTHIVMDDGLQNPSLAKSLAIAIVDGGRGFGNGAVIPAGPLRAPLEAQLARVDAIVVNAGLADTDVPTPVARDLAQRFTGPVLEARVEPNFDAAALKGRPVIAYAGIGAPKRFFDLLDRLAINTVARHTFGDHHAFTETDARQLLATAHKHNALLLTTAKDHVRLAGMSGACSELRTLSHPVPISLKLSPRDIHRLDALIAPLK